jgi:hypothetical protein
MKCGKIDRDSIRRHILTCLAALYTYESYSLEKNNDGRLFYSTVSEVADSLIPANAPHRNLSPKAIIKAHFIGTFSPTTKSSDVASNDRDWGRLHWAILASSRTFSSSTEQLATVNAARLKNGYSQVPSRLNALLIHYAAASPGASIDVIKSVTSPAAVRCKDANGRVPLHWAAMHSCSVEMLEYLLAEWPEATTVQDKDGYTPLHRLASRHAFSERAAMISKLIDADPISCSLTTSDQSTVLHLFCSAEGGKDNQDIFTELITIFPSAVRQRNRNDDLPLHALCLCPP